MLTSGGPGLVDGSIVETIDASIAIAVTCPLGHVALNGSLGTSLVYETLLEIIGKACVARLASIGPVSPRYLIWATEVLSCACVVTSYVRLTPR